jgi:20S proteasome alpha/beta subunit
MTLILCLKGKDGMVLASDSRGTFGDPRQVTAQNDNQKKVYPLSKFSGMLIAGSGEFGAMVFSEVHQQMQQKQDAGVTEVMEVVRNTLKSKFDEWFSPKRFQLQPMQGVPAPSRPELVVIIGGYDVVNGEPKISRIFTLVSALDFAPMLHDYGFALQGVGQYALYLLNRFYKPDASVGNLVALGAYTIAETASQDGKVGGPIQIMTITAQGAKELSASEVKMVADENEKRREALRGSFYGTGN